MGAFTTGTQISTLAGIRRRWLTARAALIVVILVCGMAAVSACAKYCNEVDAYDGVTISVNLPADVFSKASQIQVCIGTGCASQEMPSQNGSTVLFPFAEINSANAVDVTVKVVDGQGGQLVGGAVSVKPTTFQPNGPGCDPTVWRATVKVTSTGVSS